MIDQRRCKYIKTVAECHSFSRAAQQLYVSQPSLSRFVRKVEEELGVELFERDTTPLGLTPAGQKYLDYIERFQTLEAAMQADFASIKIGRINELVIVTLPFMGTYILPKIVPHFASNYPSVNLQIEEFNNRELLRRVESRVADLVLTNLAPESDLFCHRTLCKDPIMLAVSYNDKMRTFFPNQCGNLNHPIPVDLSLLQDETLILLHPWQNMRIAAEKVCRHFSFVPNNTMEVSSLASALSLVGSNRGMTFVCRSSVCSIRPETPLIYFSMGEMQDVTAITAVYLKDNQNPLIHKFCDCAAQSLKPISALGSDAKIPSVDSRTITRPEFSNGAP